MGKSKLGHGRGTGIPSPIDVHVGARLRVRRMDRRGHKRGLVRAKKYGTKSGAPLRRGSLCGELSPRVPYKPKKRARV